MLCLCLRPHLGWRDILPNTLPDKATFRLTGFFPKGKSWSLEHEYSCAMITVRFVLRGKPLVNEQEVG